MFKVNRHISILIGAIFFFTGIVKLFYLDSFSKEVAMYSDLYLFPWVINNSFLVAILVCSTEILLGILSFSKTTETQASVLLLIVISFFLYLTFRNYLNTIEGIGIDSCGCIGELLSLSANVSFYKNVILWILIAFNTYRLCYYNRKKNMA